MANYSLNINLLKIDGATLQTSPTTGKQAVIIPVDAADIFVNANGTAAYLGINMYESRNSQYGDCHSLKLKYNKSTIDRLGVDAIKAKPFIGNAKVKEKFNQNGDVSGDTPASPSAPQVSSNYDW